MNSWGAAWGEKGFFYLSYYDTSIRGLSWFGLDETTNYDNVLYNDERGYNIYYSIPQSSVSIANVLQVPGGSSAETLSAVSIILGSPGMSYEISAYKNPTASVLGTSTLIPTSGSQFDINGAAAGNTVTGSRTYAGYYSIPLAGDNVIHGNDKISIVVNLTSPTQEVVIPAGGKKDRNNEGLYYMSGAWRDTNDSVCIKVFTDDVVERSIQFMIGGQTYSSVSVIDGNCVVAPQPDPALDGHTFDGWYNDSALTQPFNFGDPVTTDKTLYAKFRVNNYNVVFHNDSDVTAHSVAFGSLIPAPPEPVKSGHTFAGWRVGSLSGPVWDFASGTMPAGNLDLFAEWSKNVELTESKGQAQTSVDISKATVKPVSSYTFTGKQIKPSPSVQFGGANLQRDKDYILSYGSNKAIGAGVVTITGKGNYSGAKTIKFNIIPKKVSISSLKAKNSSVTLKWRKADKAQKITAYTLAYKTGSGKWKTKTIKNKSSAVKTVIKGLKKGKTYEFRLRTYKKLGKVKYVSEWSKTKKLRIK
jgi:uncharacterized repeat protein (TIGR02543 family)